MGKFIDPYREERLKSIDDTREVWQGLTGARGSRNGCFSQVEIVMRGNAKVPPSYKAPSQASISPLTPSP